VDVIVIRPTDGITALEDGFDGETRFGRRNERALSRFDQWS